MRSSRILLFLSLPFVATSGLAQRTQEAQQTQQSRAPGTPIRDPQALTVVQTALTALGGSAAIGQPQSWQIQGQVQGTDPAGKSATGTITWETAGGEFRMAAVTNIDSEYMVTGHGNPAAVTGNGTLKLPTYVTLAKIIPALVGSILLNEFQSTHYSMRYVGTETLGTESVTVIKTSALSGDTSDRVTLQTWYFDATSGLPVRLEYLLPSLATPLVSAPGAVALSNYQAVSGAMYPFQIISYSRGKQAGTITLQSVNVNATIPSSDFDSPLAAQ